MTSSEAIAALVTLLTSTAFTGVIIAYFGYRWQRARLAKAEPIQSVVTAFGQAIPAKADMELMVQAVTSLQATLIDMKEILLHDREERKDAAELLETEKEIARRVAEQLVERLAAERDQATRDRSRGR